MNLQSLPRVASAPYYSTKAVPIYIVWMYAQDICPYTHEPILERQIVAQEYLNPSASRLKTLADYHKVSIKDLNVDTEVRYE